MTEEERTVFLAEAGPLLAERDYPMSEPCGSIDAIVTGVGRYALSPAIVLPVIARRAR